MVSRGWGKSSCYAVNVDEGRGMYEQFSQPEASWITWLDMCDLYTSHSLWRRCVYSGVWPSAHCALHRDGRAAVAFAAEIQHTPLCMMFILSPSAAVSLVQDDFSEFAEVDDLYQSLPLEKMEALENMEAAPAVPVSIVVKEKVSDTERGGNVVIFFCACQHRGEGEGERGNVVKYSSVRYAMGDGLVHGGGKPLPVPVLIEGEGA